MDRRGRRHYRNRHGASSLSSSTESSNYRETGVSVNVRGRNTGRRDPRHISGNEHPEGGDTDALFIVGTCPYMCPERERCHRERLRDLAVFERLYGNPGKSSLSLAVKKFSRTMSISDIKASDIRPLPVLEETLDYLLGLLDSTEERFEVVHDFIFDRTRSIRQDLSMQNISNDKTISMYEKMVKFHVISDHKLQHCCGSSASSMHHLNMEQLMKALASLYNLYDANKNLNDTYENEAEYRSLYMLLHLSPGNQTMSQSLALWFRHLPYYLMSYKAINFARRILRFYRLGNYKGFLCTTASEASELQYYILRPHIDKIRALALGCINSIGYKLQPYPLARLSKILLMKESEVESFCSACGLETQIDDLGMQLLPTKQTTFCSPKLQGHALIGTSFEK